MKLVKEIYLASVILLTIYGNIYPQVITTEKLSMRQGLSSSSVKQVFQDSYGLIWIATSDGLNMYDGYKIKVYKNIHDNPESIINNNIWSIAEDQEHNLWIATDDGVAAYIRSRDRFVNYKTSSIVKHAMVQSRINYVYVDSKDNVWATLTETKIWKFNRKKENWDILGFVSDENAFTNAAAKIAYPIAEDKKGMIWIGSYYNGLVFYDSEEKIFKKAKIKNENMSTLFSRLGKEITRLYFDRDNVLWITTRSGVYKYYTESKELKKIVEYTSGQFTFPAYFNSITEDKEGNVWIANNYRGILRFEGVSDKFKRVQVVTAEINSSAESNLVVTSVLADNAGILWLSTLSQGVLKYNPDSKPFILYANDPGNKSSLSSSSVLSVIKSINNPDKIYVGTSSGGLNLFSHSTRSFSQIPYKVIKDLNKGSVNAMLEEPDGSLWLGTLSDGLIKMNSNYSITERYTKIQTNNASLSDDLIKAISEDKAGNIWIGTANGLNLLNRIDKKIKRIGRGGISVYPNELMLLLNRKNKNKEYICSISQVGSNKNLTQKFTISNPGNYLVVSSGEAALQDSIMVDFGWIEDSNGKIIWTSNDLSNSSHLGGHIKNRIITGFIKLNAGNYSLRYISDQSHSYNNWNMDPPNDEELWGIRIFSANNETEYSKINRLIREAEETRFLNGRNINTIHISDNQIMWIGTEGNGLDRVNLKTKETKNYSPKTGNLNSLSNKYVQYIYEDSSGTLWLATNGGLNKFDSKKEEFTLYSMEDGLPANYISSILPGKSGELWLSTKAGISRMALNKSSNKASFVNFDLDDDLGGTNFHPSAALKLNDEKFYFGGEHGLNEFSLFNANLVPPHLIFTDLKIANKSAAVLGNRSPLKTSITNLKEITLSHSENDISFEFSALDFANPLKNQYAHKLFGYDKEWIYDNKRFATYTNLDPGKYIFMIKGSNKDGIWNEQGKSISIIILSPWWSTVWAYIIYGLLFICGVFAVDRIQRKRILSKERKNQKRLEIEHRIEAAELQSKAAEAENKLLLVEFEAKKKELDEARELQMSMLPKEVPSMKDFDIAVYMKTATEVGGDYYDFNIDPDGTLTVVIGDATGHGMKSGIMVTAAKSLFSSFASNSNILFTFKEFTRCIRNLKIPKLWMCLAMVKIRGNKMQISSAGMPPALLYRNNSKTVDEILLKGMPLGSIRDFEYQLMEITLNHGDTLLMMSDGYPEMFNKNKELFGYERVRSIYEKIAGQKPEAVIEELKNAGLGWSDGAPQDDDITFVVIKVK